MKGAQRAIRMLVCKAVCMFLLVLLVAWFLRLPFASLLLSYYAYSLERIHTETGLLLFLLAGALAGVAILFFAGKKIANIRIAEVAEMASEKKTLTVEQFSTLYDNSPIPFFLMDDAGAIAFPNKATLRFFGGTLEECAVANLYHFFLPEEKGVSDLLKAKVENGVPILNEEVMLSNFKNKVMRARLSIFSLPVQAYTTFRHTVTLEDITREYESEQMKTDFLLLASHQLRTPTTTIKWYADYLLGLKEEEVHGVVREYLGEIYKGNERMMELIRTLLTVSRIEMGTLEPKYEKVALKMLVDDVCAELSNSITQRSTRVHLDVSGEDTVITDKVMMRVAIHNLLTNAIKYTPEKGEVFVSLACEGNVCTLAVRDTGCGIALTEQNKVFQKMFRANNAKKMSSHGTGLGLFLTKAFMEKLGGAIDFISVEGKGSTFSLTIPRVALGAR